jgi:uncharacterized membrane protein YjjB (DUF3815 family)
MKLLTTALLAVLVGLAVYSARRRLWLAIRVGGIAYVVLLFGRLALSANSFADRWEDLIWPVFILLVAWAVLWAISTSYEQRKASRKGG